MKPELLYLSKQDVESLKFTMREIIEALDFGFVLRGQGKTEMPPKIGIRSVANAVIQAMPAHVQGVATGLKWVSGYPENPKRGLPYVTGLLVMNDPTTGVPIAVMDCAWITAKRTGASTAISAKYLARKDSKIAAFLGCGVQARTSLAALMEELPNLCRVSCYDIIPEAAQKFVQEMSRQWPQLQFNICSTATEIVPDTDIIVTAIPIVTHPAPPLHEGLLKDGSLAISLDYDSAWTSAAMRECIFVCDDIPQLLESKKQGVYFSGIPTEIHADLGALAAGNRAGRTSDAQKFFSMNTGIAVDDLVVARRIYDLAIQRGIGRMLPV